MMDRGATLAFEGEETGWRRDPSARVVVLCCAPRQSGRRPPRTVVGSKRRDERRATPSTRTRNSVEEERTLQGSLEENRKNLPPWESYFFLFFFFRLASRSFSPSTSSQPVPTWHLTFSRCATPQRNPGVEATSVGSLHQEKPTIFHQLGNISSPEGTRTWARLCSNRIACFGRWTVDKFIFINLVVIYEEGGVI